MKKKKFIWTGFTDHASGRAAERLGRELTYEEKLSVVSKIEAGDSVVIRKKRGLDTHVVMILGKAVSFVWDAQTKTVVTVMEGLSKNREQRDKLRRRMKASASA